MKSKNNGYYIFVVEGSVEIGDTILDSRDAIGITETDEVGIKAKLNSSLIIIEVPMIF
jgi:redox-sensitive bicupin YhaK (pirin superfamily)